MTFQVLILLFFFYERILVVGDAKRGPSLSIWAILEGRKVIEKVMKHCGVHQ